jgi:predicted PurR-regulated permease PerM
MATIFVLSAIMVIGMFVFAIIAKTCYDESLLVTAFVKQFVDQNKDFFVQKVQNVTTVQNISNSTQIQSRENPDMWHITETYCDAAVTVALQYYKYYKKFISNFVDTQTLDYEEIHDLGHRFCTQNITHVRDNMYQWGMEIVNWLAANVGWFGSGLTNFFKTTLDMINSLGDIMFSLLLFLMFLYYFIRYDSYLAKQLRSYSPLTKSETKKISNSVASKVVNTIYYAMVLAACRFITTWITFYYSQFKIIWVFSFISGFLSIIPLISSWVVWFPAAIFCIARDGLWSTPWFVIVAAHMGLYLVDSALYTSFFKGDADQRPEVLGVSIILGVYAFGWTGVFKGPVSSNKMTVLI